MEWLNNSWVVGIGGGILSGIIVTLISRYFFSRRDNREYLQRVNSANREVIYAIRPGISEGIVPSLDVIQSLINSTARKYAVDIDDVYTPTEVAEDLIKEVMDSSFISAGAKSEYCNKLNQMTYPIKEEHLEETSAESKAKILSFAAYRQRTVTWMSVLLGLIAALMTGVFAFQEFKNNLTSMPLAFALPTIIITVLMLAFETWPLLKRVTGKHEDSEELLEEKESKQVELKQERSDTKAT
jgi:hypothetical protein